jgi:predicted nuclease of predicted toxin-antitoxin system
MIAFVVDENLPRFLASELQQLGYAAKDVRDHNLGGQPDNRIYEFAQQEKAILLTADLGFSNTERFPLGAHQGIAIIRFPNELSAMLRVQEIVKALDSLKTESLGGALIIVSLGKIRIKRKH